MMRWCPQARAQGSTTQCSLRLAVISEILGPRGMEAFEGSVCTVYLSVHHFGLDWKNLNSLGDTTLGPVGVNSCFAFFKLIYFILKVVFVSII